MILCETLLRSLTQNSYCGGKYQLLDNKRRKQSEKPIQQSSQGNKKKPTEYNTWRN